MKYIAALSLLLLFNLHALAGTPESVAKTTTYHSYPGKIGLYVSETHIYWPTKDGVVRLSKEGNNAIEVVIPNLPYATAMLEVGEYLYVAGSYKMGNRGTHLYRVNLQTKVVDKLNEFRSVVSSLVADSESLYVGSFSGVLIINLASLETQHVVGSSAGQVKVHGNSIYWIDHYTSSIVRMAKGALQSEVWLRTSEGAADFSGLNLVDDRAIYAWNISSPEGGIYYSLLNEQERRPLITNLDQPAAALADSSHIYFLEGRTEILGADIIARIPLNGGRKEVLVDGKFGINLVSLREDDQYIYWIKCLSTSSIEIFRMKK